jgi:ABC-type multidrug transport system fused ATPase/permease subunit
MIQTEFSHVRYLKYSKSTVITIAHRLNTIIQYNRILVLKQGTIEEFDTPLNLLQKNSYLT